MKFLTLVFILISIACWGQPPKKELSTGTTTVSEFGIVKQMESFLNQKTILFSKGEAFTEKEWQDYRKQVLPIVKEFFKRDSSHNKFLSNTVAPHLVVGDSIESYSTTLEGIVLKLKSKKK